jgi:hypothetical protein
MGDADGILRDGKLVTVGVAEATLTLQPRVNCVSLECPTKPQVTDRQPPAHRRNWQAALNLGTVLGALRYMT